MAGYLQVDIEALGRAVQLLRNSEQVLNDAMKAMAQGGHGDIGTTELNSAADSFQRRWHFGIDRIGEAAGTTADGMSQCHDAYQQVDDQFAQVIAKVTAAIQPTTSPETTA